MGHFVHTFRRGRCRLRSPRAWAVAIAVAVLALGGCTRDDSPLDAEGNVVKAGDLSVFELEPGHCLKPVQVKSELATVPVVPCAEEHTQEVFAIERVEGDNHPGIGELEEIADRVCLDALQTDLELTLADGVYFSFLLPTFDGWNNKGDRSVVCVLVFPDRERESMQGSVVDDPSLIVRKPPAPITPGPDDEDSDEVVTETAGGET